MASGSRDRGLRQLLAFDSIRSCRVQVISQPQPLADAAAALATLCASGHARLAARHLMDLLKEALYAVHMPRFWLRLAPLASAETTGDLLGMLPTAIQVALHLCGMLSDAPRATTRVAQVALVTRHITLFFACCSFSLP